MTLQYKEPHGQHIFSMTMTEPKNGDHQCTKYTTKVPKSTPEGHRIVQGAIQSSVHLSPHTEYDRKIGAKPT